MAVRTVALFWLFWGAQTTIFVIRDLHVCVMCKLWIWTIHGLCCSKHGSVLDMCLHGQSVVWTNLMWSTCAICGLRKYTKPHHNTCLHTWRIELLSYSLKQPVIWHMSASLDWASNPWIVSTNADPCFEQCNPQIVHIHGLRITSATIVATNWVTLHWRLQHERNSFTIGFLH